MHPILLRPYQCSQSRGIEVQGREYVVPEMFREISNSVDSVAIFGSPWPCPMPFFDLGCFYDFCCILFFALFRSSHREEEFFS